MATKRVRKLQTPAPAKARLAEASPPAPNRPIGKTRLLTDLLRRPNGARIDEMMTATGWQAHSVRGAIAGTLKKKLGLAISSEKTEAGRVYRIVGEAKA